MHKNYFSYITVSLQGKEQKIKAAVIHMCKSGGLEEEKDD